MTFETFSGSLSLGTDLNKLKDGWIHVWQPDGDVGTRLQGTEEAVRAGKPWGGIVPDS